MVSGLLELLEIMGKREGCVSSILAGIKSLEIRVGTSGGIRFLFVLRSEKVGRSFIDRAEKSPEKRAKKQSRRGFILRYYNANKI